MVLSKKDSIKELIRKGITKFNVDMNDLRGMLDYFDVRELTYDAMGREDFSTILFLARVNKIAVADAISSFPEYEVTFRKNIKSNLIPKLYFELRSNLSESKKKFFLRLVRRNILRKALQIAGMGLRGSKLRHKEMDIGDSEFDLEATIENSIGREYVTRKDIIALERDRKKKNVVLILDTSGSMYGDKIFNAALSAAVLSYHMRNDRYSIIVFNNDAFMLKSFDEDKKLDEILEEILDTEPIGYTRIDNAIRMASKELKKIKERNKWAIIITDGCYNLGEDPIPLVSMLPKLHVIQIPNPSRTWCEEVCRELAKRGGGKLVKVEFYKEIPSSLLKVLREMSASPV
ncbi:MAG: vWA domain-containing protein [Candidatus Asgardarchaeia archaeon]